MFSDISEHSLRSALLQSRRAAKQVLQATLLLLLMAFALTAEAQTVITASPVAPAPSTPGTGLNGKYFGRPFQEDNTSAANYIAANAPMGTFTALQVAFPRETYTYNDGTALLNFLTDSGNATNLSTGVTPNATLDGQLMAFDGYIKVTNDMDRDPATPGIQIDLAINSDDGSFVEIGSQRILDAGGNHGFGGASATFTFNQPGLYPVHIVYYENGGFTGVTFYSRSAGQADYHAAPTAMLYSSPNISVTKTVLGTAGPWDFSSTLNSLFQYGVHDFTPPTIFSGIDGFAFTPGTSLVVQYVSGTVSAGGSYPLVDANGDPNYPFNNGGGSSGLGSPAKYMDAATYPINLTALVGTFADANGVIVGTPFKVGNGPTSLLIPTGAVRLQLGTVDDIYRDNPGSFQVSVSGLPAVLGNQPPHTFITSGPAEGSTITQNSATFVYTGTDNVTPTANLSYKYSLDGGTFSAPTTNTMVDLSALSNGAHTFQVAAINAAGLVDTTPPIRHFTVDTTPTNISDPTVTQIAYNNAVVNWTTDKPTSAVIEVALNDGAPFLPLLSYTDSNVALNHAYRVGPLKSNTAYRVRVRAIDGGGLTAATSNAVNFATPILRDLSVSADDIVYSNPAPADGASITMTVKVKNPGDVTVSATLVFYDVKPNGNTVEISRQSVSVVPNAANDTVVTSAPFTVDEGTHRPYVLLTNQQPGDDNGANDGAIKDLQVGAPANRLQIVASDQQTYPGDDRLFTVIVRNTGSAAQMLTAPAVTGVNYVTLASPLPSDPLQPGAQAQLTFHIQTPSGETGGAPPNPVAKKLNVAIGAFTQDFNLRIFNAAVGNLDVTVVDDTSGNPLGGVLVAIDGSNTSWITGPDGKLRDRTTGIPTTIPTLTGTLNLYGYLSHYIAKSVNVATTTGAQSYTLRLTPGETLQVTQVTTHQLTQQEIIQRGVNLSDPNNYVVYDFVLYMRIGPITIPNVIVPVGGPSFGGGSFIVPGGGGGSIYSTVNVQYKIDPVTNSQIWIVIPGDVRILKQFWDATVFVRNNSSSINITDVVAGLNVPTGLSLPDLNGLPQPVSQTLGTIAPLTQKQASWVVRGDTAGRYRLTGTASGNIALGGSTVALSASLLSDPLDVFIPKVGVTFRTPTFVVAGQIFTVGIDVQNQSPIDLNGVIVDIRPGGNSLASGLVNCTIAPGETLAHPLNTIPVGETRSTSFNFVSLVTGQVLEVRSIVTPLPVEPNITVTPQPVHPPIANDDSAATLQGQAVTIPVTNNDSDPDGYAIAVTAATQGANGTTSVSGNTLVYTPNAGFTGTDSFTYTIGDGRTNAGGNPNTAVATVRVQVNAPATAPAQVVIGGISGVTRSGGNITATVTLKNTGGSAANNIQLTASQLGSAAATAPSPLPNIGTLASGASTNVTLTYPDSAGLSGALVFLRINGVYTGGNFNAAKRLTLP